MSTILITEDEYFIAADCADIVERQGHTVIMAASLADAVRALDAGGIDAVISDFNLGKGETGAQVFSHVNGRAPFMLMSSYSPEQLANMGFDPSARDILFCRKPFGNEFGDAVQELVGRIDSHRPVPVSGSTPPSRAPN
jgi:DNA-binding NtrC family response regulator